MQEGLYNIKLTLAYDGNQFLGWQATPEGPSIEETLKNAIERVLQHPVILQAASRTDAGVHAKAQVVNFFTNKDIDLSRFLLSINRMVPPSISLLDAQVMPLSFHPTLDNIGKEYHYHLCYGPVQNPFFRHYSWHYPSSLNRELMQEAASLLTGEHDFRSFCNYRKQLNYTDTRRRVDLIELVDLEKDRVCIKISGNHFLYKMVRNLVGTLVYVGQGKLGVDQILRILNSKDRRLAGVTAPAHGLFLVHVHYNPINV